MKKKIKFEDIRLFIYACSLVIIFFVVIGKIEMKCFFFENFGIQCPACGLTRATIAVLHLNFVEAIKYNAYYTLVLIPLIMILIINDLYVVIQRKINSKKHLPSFVEIILGVK